MVRIPLVELIKRCDVCGHLLVEHRIDPENSDRISTRYTCEIPGCDCRAWEQNIKPVFNPVPAF